jgi:NAD(P)-dependent dehydrogenase (short-subunit alcohol dehydrogenase family)
MVRDARIYPPNRYDAHHQQVDLRPVNSWLLEPNEISQVEYAEVQMINTLAPTFLINRLLPLLAAAGAHPLPPNASSTQPQEKEPSPIAGSGTTSSAKNSSDRERYDNSFASSSDCKVAASCIGPMQRAATSGPSSLREGGHEPHKKPALVSAVDVAASGNDPTKVSVATLGPPGAYGATMGSAAGSIKHGSEGPAKQEGGKAVLGEDGLGYGFVVNVSSMEGKFDKRKCSHHVHTNMAKAALNMFTRTVGPWWAKSYRVLVTSVDTGWIDDMTPLRPHLANGRRYITPIDDLDGAARVLDPILQFFLHRTVLSGIALKDFHIDSW